MELQSGAEVTSGDDVEVEWEWDITWAWGESWDEVAAPGAAQVDCCSSASCSAGSECGCRVEPAVKNSEEMIRAVSLARRDEEIFREEGSAKADMLVYDDGG
eukprot:NODE_14179_length_1123_cov_14.848394.p3 GENE.NODE_14179_length_1123_cov_14.848394~~NODE_14179_length_1123_cov_14.848394.p3  ORF type:complete len:102 (+),score=26.40 NODE_14179_length_1123_cov_14.848394:701-1006(+)